MGLDIAWDREKMAREIFIALVSGRLLTPAYMNDCRDQAVMAAKLWYPEVTDE